MIEHHITTILRGEGTARRVFIQIKWPWNDTPSGIHIADFFFAIDISNMLEPILPGHIAVVAIAEGEDFRILADEFLLCAAQEPLHI